MVRRMLAWDEAVLVSVSRSHPRWLTKAMRSITHLGDGPSWALMAVVLILLEASWTGWGASLAMGLLVSTGAAQVLKRLCRRKRPNLGIPGFLALAENPDAFSFPSGHTAAACAVAAVFWSHPTLGVFFAGLAMLVGLSRIFLGAHYPLDVLLGGLLGVASGSTASLLRGLL